MDIHELGNSLQVVVAVGAVRDVALIQDEMRSQRTLSYEVSPSRPVPLIKLFRTDVNTQPTTFVVDFGSSAANGHKFLDVAVLRDY